MICNRFLSMITALFVIVTATFFLMKAIPGDPFSEEQSIPTEVLEALRDHYHFNDPLFSQYLHYLKSVVSWDLGPSFKYKSRTVNEIISQGMSVSFALGAEALLISCALGISLGTIGALRQKRWQDYCAMTLAVLGVSVPSFLLATFLQYLFAIKLNLLPVARWGTFAHSILPALALAALPTAFIARLTRASMVEVLRQDYIKTALAKGMKGRQVILFHVMRNSLLPVLTYLGPLIANILVGSFVVERIFGIPGLGQWFVNSIASRDYTVIMGMTVFYSAILLVAVFLVDVAYHFLDPRLERKHLG
ncbi:MAG: ABC transporter permease [Verrucomicrobia bacterium]|nr:ABC transporter permease [Verrucomicrobiota bacterium]